jgi:DNA-binding response OmpR family regulator
MPYLLLVDDDETITTATSYFFRARGFRVDCASELEEAQALISHRRYDAVVADLRLTGIHGAEGLEIIDHLRRNSPATRIVLLTAHGSEEIAIEARARGANAVLSKPQPLTEISALVQSLLETA